MLRLSASVCIDAPAAVVWNRLASLEDIQLWSEAIRRAICGGPLSRGVGAERTCQLVGNIVIHEAELELKGGHFGRLLEPLMALLFQRMGSNSLAAFKYLIENGRPYAGKHSATC